MLKKSLLFIAFLVSLLGAPPARSAEVPMLLNYQGSLTDPSGAPKNGTFSMQFAIYDAETGGNQLPSASPWNETQSVTVTNGVFNVLLGSVTALPTNLFEGGPSDASGPLRLLEVTVNGEVLTPRRRIASAAYAIAAGGTCGVFKFAGYSATKVNGGVTFNGMRSACQADYGPEARFCTAKEFYLSAVQSVPSEAAWIQPEDLYSYLGTCPNCWMWTSSIETGCVIDTDGMVKGAATWVFRCDAQRPVTCCVPAQ